MVTMALMDTMKMNATNSMNSTTKNPEEKPKATDPYLEKVRAGEVATALRVLAQAAGAAKASAEEAGEPPEVARAAVPEVERVLTV